MCFKPTRTERLRQTDALRQTDRLTDEGRWAGAAKPGQQRTRLMSSHSSHSARLLPGKDRGRRVREQGEQRWGRMAVQGVACSGRPGEGDQVIKSRSWEVVVIYVFVCAPDLEPWQSGWCGGGDERPHGDMGKDDQWQTTSCQPDTLETRTQTLTHNARNLSL